MVLCQTHFKEGHKPADPTAAAPQYRFQSESHLLPSKENKYVNKYYSQDNMQLKIQTTSLYLSHHYSTSKMKGLSSSIKSKFGPFSLFKTS